MTKDDTKRAPLIGWMIIEDYCEDMSQWDGVISFPDPTGANLAWQNPTKMIEFSAFDLVLNTLKQIFDATPCDEWPRPLIMNVTNQLGLDMDWKPK